MPDDNKRGDGEGLQKDGERSADVFWIAGAGVPHGVRKTTASRYGEWRLQRSVLLIDVSAIGWKEAALVALVILAVFMGYALMRLSALGASRSPSEPERVADPDTPTIVPAAPALQADQLEAMLDTLLDRRLAPLMQQMETRLEQAELRIDELGRRVETVNQLPPLAPQYSEALSLAARGLSAEEIADQCEMSVGEAELVRTLAKSRGMGGGDEA
jgi:hypothetical protein